MYGNTIRSAPFLLLDLLLPILFLPNILNFHHCTVHGLVHTPFKFTTCSPFSSQSTMVNVEEASSSSSSSVSFSKSKSSRLYSFSVNQNQNRNNRNRKNNRKNKRKNNNRKNNRNRNENNQFSGNQYNDTSQFRGINNQFIETNNNNNNNNIKNQFSNNNNINNKNQYNSKNQYIPNGRNNRRKTNPNSETFYDILQIDKKSSQADIKRQYFKLAKSLHPDTQFRNNINESFFDKDRGTNSNNFNNKNSNNNNNNSNTISKTDQFIKVSNAYKTLSDPLLRKRYDRSLQAEAFTQDIEQAAARVSKQAAPYVKDLIENIAAPFLKKTGATTRAFLDAAKEEESNVGSVFQATSRASKIVDKEILVEKSQELEMKARQQWEELDRTREKQMALSRTKLLLSLKIPDAPLSSEEAQFILDYFNTTDSKSIMDYALMKHTVQYEIDQLRETEREFDRKVKLFTLLEEEYLQSQRDLESISRREEVALQDIERLQQELVSIQDQLNEAQSIAIDARTGKTELWKNVTALEEAQRRSQQETDRLFVDVGKRREVVKNALLKKEEDIVRRENRDVRRFSSRNDTEYSDYYYPSGNGYLNDLNRGNYNNNQNVDPGYYNSNNINDLNTNLKENNLDTGYNLNGNSNVNSGEDGLNGDYLNNNYEDQPYQNYDDQYYDRNDMMNRDLDLTRLSPTMRDYQLLKKEEAFLKEESLRMESRAARLLSRSESLMEQSRRIPDFQNNENDDVYYD